jgi:hypothetical protein
MSIGPSGIAASVAGTSLTQTAGSELERTHGEVGAQRRRVYYGGKAEAAAGVGQPDGEDHQTDERGADGRRPWEEPAASAAADASQNAARSVDPSRQCGNLLDLDG